MLPLFFQSSWNRDSQKNNDPKRLKIQSKDTFNHSSPRYFQM